MAWAKRFGTLAVRLLIVSLAARLLIALPDPASDETLHFKNAIVVLVSIIVMGKLLYDTLFFDRYYS